MLKQGNPKVTMEPNPSAAKQRLVVYNKWSSGNGGCINWVTWRQNPQYKIQILPIFQYDARQKHLEIQLARSKESENVAFGGYLVKIEEDENDLVIDLMKYYRNGTLMRVPFGTNSAVKATFEVEIGYYVFIPCTFEPLSLNSHDLAFRIIFNSSDASLSVASVPNPSYRWTKCVGNFEDFPFMEPATARSPKISLCCQGENFVAIAFLNALDASLSPSPCLEVWKGNEKVKISNVVSPGEARLNLEIQPDNFYTLIPRGGSVNLTGSKGLFEMLIYSIKDHMTEVPFVSPCPLKVFHLPKPIEQEPLQIPITSVSDERLNEQPLTKQDLSDNISDAGSQKARNGSSFSSRNRNSVDASQMDDPYSINNENINNTNSPQCRKLISFSDPPISVFQNDPTRTPPNPLYRSSRSLQNQYEGMKLGTISQDFTVPSHTLMRSWSADSSMFLYPLSNTSTPSCPNTEHDDRDPSHTANTIETDTTHNSSTQNIDDEEGEEESEFLIRSLVSRESSEVKDQSNQSPDSSPSISRLHQPHLPNSLSSNMTGFNSPISVSPQHTPRQQQRHSMIIQTPSKISNTQTNSPYQYASPHSPGSLRRSVRIEHPLIPIAFNTAPPPPLILPSSDGFNSSQPLGNGIPISLPKFPLPPSGSSISSSPSSTSLFSSSQLSSSASSSNLSTTSVITQSSSILSSLEDENTNSQFQGHRPHVLSQVENSNYSMRSTYCNIRGMWKGKTSGGSSKFALWRNNIQYLLQVFDHSCTLSFNLGQLGSQPPTTIGVYVLKVSDHPSTNLNNNHGIDKLLQIEMEDHKATPFEDEISIMRHLNLQIGCYVVIPCTENPGIEREWNLAIKSSKPESIFVSQLEDRWKSTSMEGTWDEWSSGGSYNEVTWMDNPQYQLKINASKIRDPTRIVIVLNPEIPSSPPAYAGNGTNDASSGANSSGLAPAAGFYLIKNTTQFPRVLEVQPDQLMFQVKFRQRLDISHAFSTASSLNISNNSMIPSSSNQVFNIVPCTYSPRIFGKFKITVYYLEEGILSLEDTQSVCAQLGSCGKFDPEVPGGHFDFPSWRYNKQLCVSLYLSTFAHIGIVLYQCAKGQAPPERNNSKSPKTPQKLTRATPGGNSNPGSQTGITMAASSPSTTPPNAANQTPSSKRVSSDDHQPSSIDNTNKLEQSPFVDPRSFKSFVESDTEGEGTQSSQEDVSNPKHFEPMGFYVFQTDDIQFKRVTVGKEVMMMPPVMGSDRQVAGFFHLNNPSLFSANPTSTNHVINNNQNNNASNTLHRVNFTIMPFSIKQYVQELVHYELRVYVFSNPKLATSQTTIKSIQNLRPLISHRGEWVDYNTFEMLRDSPPSSSSNSNSQTSTASPSQSNHKTSSNTSNPSNSGSAHATMSRTLSKYLFKDNNQGSSSSKSNNTIFSTLSSDMSKIDRSGFWNSNITQSVSMNGNGDANELILSKLRRSEIFKFEILEPDTWVVALLLQKNFCLGSLHLFKMGSKNPNVPIPSFDYLNDDPQIKRKEVDVWNLMNCSTIISQTLSSRLSEASIEREIKEVGSYALVAVPDEFDTSGPLLIVLHHWKPVKSLMTSASNASEMANHRMKIIDEIVGTEKAYIKNLEILQNHFYKELKSISSKLNLKEEDLNRLFANLPAILKCNSSFLVSLTETINKKEFAIGKVFRNYIEYFKMYAEYTNHYESRIKIVESWKEKKGFLKKFTQLSMDPKVNNLDFFDYYICPVQRLPRYVLLLEQLIKYSDPTHFDFSDLTSGLAHLKKVVYEMNEKKRRVDSENQVLSIQSMVYRKNEGSTSASGISGGAANYLKQNSGTLNIPSQGLAQQQQQQPSSSSSSSNSKESSSRVSLAIPSRLFLRCGTISISHAFNGDFSSPPTPSTPSKSSKRSSMVLSSSFPISGDSSSSNANIHDLPFTSLSSLKQIDFAFLFNDLLLLVKTKQANRKYSWKYEIPISSQTDVSSWSQKCICIRFQLNLFGGAPSTLSFFLECQNTQERDLWMTELSSVIQLARAQLHKRLENQFQSTNGAIKLNNVKIPGVASKIHALITSS